MIHKYILLLVASIPLFCSAQGLEIVVENYAELETLTSQYHNYGNTDIFINNVSNQDLTVTIMTESIDMPSGWETGEAILTSEDGTFTLQEGDNYLLYYYLEVLLIDPASWNEKGTHDLRITAQLADGAIVHDEVVTICYDFTLNQGPSPSFRILESYQDTITADTIYLPFEIIDPFNRDFYMQTELNFYDYWGTSRYIVFEPIELISENIVEMTCNLNDDPSSPTFGNQLCLGDTIYWSSDFINHFDFHGKLGQSNDYKYELLLNVYDLVDSTNSRQQVRFIAVDAGCLNGKEANLVIGQNNNAYVCQGSDITLTGFPNYGELTFTNQNTGEETTGTSFTVTNIQESISLYITSVDEEGCMLFQYYYISIEERYEPIIEQNQGNLEFCTGEDITLNVVPGYTNVIWLNEMTNETFFTDTIVIENIQQEMYFRVQALAGDNCTVTDNTFLYVNPDGRMAPIVSESDSLFVCGGGAISIAAQPEYDNVTWTNQETGISEQGSELVLFDVTQPVYYYVTATGVGTCDFFQYLEIIPDQEQYADDITEHDEYVVCLNGSLTINGSLEYTDFEWRLESSGATSAGNSFTLNNVSHLERVTVTAKKVNGEGCKFFQEIYVFVDDTGTEDPSILKTEEGEFCRKVTLEAIEGYSDYKWYNVDYQTSNFVLVGTDRIMEIDYSSYPPLWSPLLRLEVSNAGDCGLYYIFEFVLKQAEEKDLIDEASLGTYCEGDPIKLATLENYETYEWNYDGEIFTDSAITIEVSDKPVSLEVTDAAGCLYKDIFYSGLSALEAPSLCLITTEAGTNNNVILFEDPTNASNISEYVIYREGEATDQFDSIGVVDVDLENIFTDTESDPTQQAYKYQVRSKNDCGNTSSPSNTHKTIHLTINQGTNGNINLIWDDYEGIEYVQVKILRGQTLADLQDYVVLPSTVVSFTDQNPPAGDVFYQLEITTVVECDTKKSSYVVRSNVAEILMSDATENLYGVQNISTEHLAQGIYFVKIISNGKFYSQQFIKL